MQIYLDVAGLPLPRGPFSHGVAASGEFLFVSGQGCYHPDEKRFIRGSIGEQTLLTLNCIDRILQKAGTSRERVIACRVFLQPLTQETFDAMNRCYLDFFGSHKPARTTVGVQLLNIDVEIDCVALLK